MGTAALLHFHALCVEVVGEEESWETEEKQTHYINDKIQTYRHTQKDRHTETIFPLVYLFTLCVECQLH